MLYNYDHKTNNDVKNALEWVEWLSVVKDPGIALLTAKKHVTTLLHAYNEMYALLSAKSNNNKEEAKMYEIPPLYGRHTFDGTTHKYEYSLEPLPGFERITPPYSKLSED